MDPRSEHARLHWQCRRGMRELDLLLQDFLDHAYGTLSAPERGAFGRLLEYPDQLLLEYLMGALIPADQGIADVVARIRLTITA